jgi:hypothetical protein
VQNPAKSIIEQSERMHAENVADALLARCASSNIMSAVKDVLNEDEEGSAEEGTFSAAEEDATSPAHVGTFAAPAPAPAAPAVAADAQMDAEAEALQ